MRERRGLIIHPEELDETWAERLQEAHINVLGLHPVGGKNAHLSLEGAIHRHLLPQARARRKELERRGIAVEYEAHAMGWLLPRSLFADVPEWFRMNERGERADDFNLCASNAEALEFVSRRAEQLARLLETGSDRYYFWLDDVRGCGCQCEQCRRLSASDQQMTVVNAMLKGIRRYNRQAKLCYLAYADALDAPKQVGPLDGVFLEYAPFDRDSHRPLLDETCPQNAREARSIRGLMDVFGAKDSQVLEYWMDNSRFSGWKKPPVRLTLDEGVLREDLNAYRTLGFDSVTSFGCYLGADYRALWGEPPVRAYGDILFEGWKRANGAPRPL